MYRRQNWITKLERRFGRLAIPNLMMILVGAMAIVWLFDYLIGASTGQSLQSMLYFDRAMIAHGQVWRIFTFIFLPPQSSMLFIIFALYFYYLIGGTLEREWGSFGFTLFYLFGIVGAIIGGLITGSATNDYLNMSLFLAFALLNPNFEVLLFFFIPIKMKWLALIDGLSIVYLFVISSLPGKVGILFSMANLLIFFTPSLVEWVKSIKRRIDWNRKMRK